MQYLRIEKLSKAIASLAALLLPSAALAISTLQPKLRDQEIRLGLQAKSYLTQSAESASDQGTGNASFSLGLRGIGEEGSFHFGAEAETLIGVKGGKYRYLDIGEIYAGLEKIQAPKRVAFFVGRKRFNWNELDSEWSLGLYQPRFRWDYLNERENGILGAFLGFRLPFAEFTAYASPIFVPEQGAPFDISNGSCRSSSPWFSCPSSTISVFNQPTNVNFTLDIPPMKDLVSHAGHGAYLRLGKDTGPFLRASYTKKPMNQFLLSFEGRLNLGSGTIPAIIRPRVLQHELLGMDIGWKEVRHSIVSSLIQEKPIRDITPSSWNTQEVSNATLMGVTAMSHPIASLKHTRLEASWLHRQGGNEPDRGPFVNASNSYFEPRYSFQNAFSVAGFSSIRDQWSRRFQASIKFIFDTNNTGNLLMTDFFLSPFSRFVVNLGVDIIGSDNPSPVDFLSRYQRNDRLRIGLAYSF